MSSGPGVVVEPVAARTGQHPAPHARPPAVRRTGATSTPGSGPAGAADRQHVAGARAAPGRARRARRWSASRAPARRRRRRAPRRRCAAPVSGGPSRSSLAGAAAVSRRVVRAAPRRSGAPVVTTVSRSASARSTSPPKVTSSTAAPGWLPTSRLAQRGTTPGRRRRSGRCRARPGRAGRSSWTVVSGPGASTVSARVTGRPRRTAPGCPDAAAPPARGRGRTPRASVRPSSCQPPGDSRG